MSDFDQTVYSGRGAPGVPGGQPPAPAKRNPLLIIGGIGCVLLLCILLLIGGGFFLARDRLNTLVADIGLATAEVPIVPVEEATPPVVGVEETATVGAVDVTVTVEEELAATATPEPTVEEAATAPPVSSEPTMGEITFALGATSDYEPIDPAISFQEGITEVHAIFEYSGMSKDDTWERVWYLNDQEVLRSAEPWAGAEAGIFDYFINAGGDPLSPGEWLLELYVDGEMLTGNSFTIEGAGPVVAQAGTETPEPAQSSTPILPAAIPTSLPIASPTPTKTSSGGGGGSGGGGTFRLAYTKWDGGKHNLFIANTNGGGEQFIMNRAAGPSWMSGGSYVFFFGEPGVNQQDRSDRPGVGSCELQAVSDGIVSVQVPNPPNDVCVAFPEVYQDLGWKEGTARWTSVSPDGKMVAYDARPGGDWRIYFLGTTDNQQFRFELVGEQADWSPDSQKVVYRSGRDGKTGIWMSNRDDSGHTQITSGGADSFPAWSPDGRTIVFSRDEGGNVDLYAVNVDGSNLRRLTEATGPDTLPTFTPTGDIIFRSARSGSWGIWKMSGTGGGQTEIIPNAGVGPDWAYSKMDVSK